MTELQVARIHRKGVALATPFAVASNVVAGLQPQVRLNRACPRIPSYIRIICYACTMAPVTTRATPVASSLARNKSSRLEASTTQSPLTPDLSDDSDKENGGKRISTSSLGKRKTAPRVMSTPSQTQGSASNKRRRIDDKGKGPASQSARRKELSEKVDDSFYDPDQDEATKRRTVKGYRELHSLLNDSRADFLQRGSKGIQNTLREADNLIKNVKQTSTATIDSRLLVNVGDLAYKKISTMTLGDSSTAIDVDDFLSKCIAYMKSNPNSSTQNPPTSTQRRRQQRRARDHDGDASDDEEIADLDWAHLGRTICFPASNRPCLSSFLLGPLSVQKKVRQPTQRRATQRATQDPALATRTIEVDQATLDRQESASLTSICSEIASLLQRTQTRGERLVEKEVADREARGIEVSEDDIRSIMRSHNIASNGGVPLFHFCLNPQSFGQTVENFFYVSFLIKEGRVGLDFDDDNLPTLGMVAARTVQERQETQRNQAVFTLDFDMWEELVKSFGVQKSVVPHREAQTWEDDDGVIHDEMPVRARRDGTSAASESVPPESTFGVGVEEDEDMYGAG